jgi:hypothetical protein
MAVQGASSRRSQRTRDRNSIPVLVVCLGPARDFLIAIAVFAVWIMVAMVVAFVAFA